MVEVGDERIADAEALEEEAFAEASTLHSVGLDGAVAGKEVRPGGRTSASAVEGSTPIDGAFLVVVVDVVAAVVAIFIVGVNFSSFVKI